MCFITLGDSGPHRLVDVRAKRNPRKQCNPCRGHWVTTPISQDPAALNWNLSEVGRGWASINPEECSSQK